MVAYAGLSTIQISQLASYIADAMGVSLVFEATDKSISNFSYSGPLYGLVVELQRTANIDAFLDDDKLIVQDRGKNLKDQIVSVSEADRNMIGIPTFFEWGVVAKVLADPSVRLGGAIRVNSLINPAANGDYVICKMDYELCSRDTPFYFNVWGYRGG
jgi:hypothetical protein